MQKSTILLFMTCVSLVLSSLLATHLPVYAQEHDFTLATDVSPLVTSGAWQAHTYDLVYSVAFSSQQKPDGPLVIYRASATDLHMAVPIAALSRDPSPATPLLYPSRDGHYVAVVTPQHDALNGASLSIISTETGTRTLLLSQGVAAADQPIWSADSQALYYHTGTQPVLFAESSLSNHTSHSKGSIRGSAQGVGDFYDEIHRVDVHGHDSVLLHRIQGDGSLHLIGLDLNGALILTLARLEQPVALMRVLTTGAAGQFSIIMNLPSDILPGNVLRVGSDGVSVECERVLNWHPLSYSTIHISFSGGVIAQVVAPFDTSIFGAAVTALNASTDGVVQTMTQVLTTRGDLAAQGIPNVPSQEALLLFDTKKDALQRLTLPAGGQIIQTFWDQHIAQSQLHPVTTDVLARLLAEPAHVSPMFSQNASPQQQEEWMLEAHANTLVDGPTLPSMCYGTCQTGHWKAAHISAAIMRGVAFTESNWHQFNANDYRVLNEPIGSPIKSFDGGWGEFQQTWAMPPQCSSGGNCRSDFSKIQTSQSYNIGTGAQALADAWNSTAGVSSNDPYKANNWFFAVWAYNGSYGNNPNDVTSSTYGHWYPGAPFRAIYEEYVWYYAAHPQYATSGWTDDYTPDLGSSLLPPQSAFAGTNDSFVACATCVIPDWTTGSYDRDQVGLGVDTKTAGYFKTAFTNNGGEDVVGLPRDNGGHGVVHRWNKGWMQDFGGSNYRPGALLLADGTTTAYWIFGGIWTRYVTDGGAAGCHGYPTSALNLYTNSKLGTDSFVHQTFQKGSITWDATKKSVAADTCV